MTQDDTYPLYIYGAGGHAREIAWLIDSSSPCAARLVGFVDDAKLPDNWPDSRAVVSFEFARQQHPNAMFTVAIGSPAIRKSIVSKLEAAGAQSATLIHSTVQTSRRLQMGEGCVLFSGSHLTVDISLGKHVHVNQGCTLSHDVVLGDFVTLSPGVHVCGNVTVEDGVFIGAGATVINGTPQSPLIVGEGAYIAAGACVVDSVTPNMMYAGVPAVPIKNLKCQESIER